MTTPDGAVTLACAAAGTLYGLLGSLAFLRRQSLRGDILAHAAWPGVLLAFAITGLGSPTVLALGALVSALVFGNLISLIERLFPRFKGDAAPALLLSGCFAGGSVIWSLLQRHVEGLGQAGLKSFLLGQAAAVQWEDAWTLVGVLFVSMALVGLLRRDIALALFDREQGILLGRRVSLVEFLLDMLLAVAVVTGLTIVGVVVLSALLVAIPLATRPFTHRLGPFLVASTLLGAVVGLATPWLVMFLETKLQGHGRGIPTGPIFVLLASSLCFLSMATRGLLARQNAGSLRESTG